MLLREQPCKWDDSLTDYQLKSRMMGDYQVRFCERLGVKFPLPTRPLDKLDFIKKMKITLDDLTVKFDNNSSDRLTEDWTWLIGANKTPILVSAIGDIFLRDDNKKIYWLDVGAGKVELVANGIQDFEEKLKDVEHVNNWFMVDLIAELKLSGQGLKDGQLYSYKILPTLGGDYSTDNFEPTDMVVHFSLAGQIQKQIKDLPDGTKINKVKFK